MSVYSAETPENLDEALRSVWDDQVLKPQEIILIKDGTLDPRLDRVIDRWKGRLGDRLVLLSNDCNKGLTVSLNRGIDVAGSEYIARMDTDDVALPNRFAIQSAFLDSHPDVVVVGGYLQEFNRSNDCLLIRRYPLSPEDVRDYIHKATPVAHPAVMMRADLFRSGLRYDERYRTSQDIALWFDLLLKGYKISNVPEVILKFRREDKMFWRRGKKKAFNEFRIYMNGIRRMRGIWTPAYVYPVMRFIFRLMPTWLIGYVYNSFIRTVVLAVRSKGK